MIVLRVSTRAFVFGAVSFGILCSNSARAAESGCDACCRSGAPTPTTSAGRVALEPAAVERRLLVDVSMSLRGPAWRAVSRAAGALPRRRPDDEAFTFGSGDCTESTRAVSELSVSAARSAARRAGRANYTPLAAAIYGQREPGSRFDAVLDVVLTDGQGECAPPTGDPARTRPLVLFASFGDFDEARATRAARQAAAVAIRTTRRTGSAITADANEITRCVFRLPDGRHGHWSAGDTVLVERGGIHGQSTAVSDRVLVLDPQTCAADGAPSVAPPTPPAASGCVLERGGTPLSVRLRDAAGPTAAPSAGSPPAALPNEVRMSQRVVVRQSDPSCADDVRIVQCWSDPNNPERCDPAGGTPTTLWCGARGMPNSAGPSAPRPEIHPTPPPVHTLPLDGTSVLLPGDTTYFRMRPVTASGAGSSTFGVALGVRPMRALRAARASVLDPRGPSFYIEQGKRRDVAGWLLGMIDSAELSMAGVADRRSGTVRGDAYTVAVNVDVAEFWKSRGGNLLDRAAVNGIVTDHETTKIGDATRDAATGFAGDGSARVARCIEAIRGIANMTSAERDELERTLCPALRDRFVVGASAALDLLEIGSGASTRTRADQLHAKAQIRLRLPIVTAHQVLAEFFSLTLQSGVDHFLRKPGAVDTQTAGRGVGRSAVDMSLRLDLRVRWVAIRAEVGAHANYRSNRGAPTLRDPTRRNDRFFPSAGAGIDLILPWHVSVGPSLRTTTFDGVRDLAAFVGVGLAFAQALR